MPTPTIAASESEREPVSTLQPPPSSNRSVTEEKEDAGDSHLKEPAAQAPRSPSCLSPFAAPTKSRRGSHQSVSSNLDLGPPIEIRDFAYPETSPLHYGRPLDRRASEISLSSSEFTGRHARALYDFVPETEYEIGMKAGEVVWVQYRQCPGWLIADVQDETGLIPESYVEFL